MEHLLRVPTDYWGRFLIVEQSDEQKESDTDKELKSRSYFGTPTIRNANTTLRKERKFFATPPYSAKRK